jgi:uncharacterized membrane protein YhaH (DUF805 family)
MTLVSECITKKYATFSGRANRKEYWLFFLFSLVVPLCFLVLGDLLENVGDAGAIFGLLASLSILFFFIPVLSVGVRRLHDINRSGYWWFISLVPVIGGAWLFILTCLRGTIGPNDFGSEDGNPDLTSKQQRLEDFVRRLDRLEKN